MPLSMSRRVVSFQVFGIAQPKGSTRAFIPRGWKRPIITTDNPKSKGWQQLVAEQAQTVAREGLFLGPVVLRVVFQLPRPQSLPKHRQHHTKKPDLDKLIRSTKDALKGVLYTDDAQVVDIHAQKVYAPTGSAPCALVTLEEADAPAPLQTSAHAMFDQVEAAR